MEFCVACSSGAVCVPMLCGVSDSESCCGSCPLLLSEAWQRSANAKNLPNILVF